MVAVKEFDKGITAYQIAQSISERLADEVLAAKVNGSIIEICNDQFTRMTEY